VNESMGCLQLKPLNTNDFYFRLNNSLIKNLSNLLSTVILMERNIVISGFELSEKSYQSLFVSRVSIHGHRTLKAPHPVRSAQLTRVPPS
jgi:hypothetical protein